MSVFRVSLPAALVLLAATAGPAAATPRNGVPDQAMLQAGDLGGAKPHAADAESWPALRPPRPCGLEAPAPVADRAVSAVIDVGGAPEVILEHVALHKPGRAREYLRDLRRALRSCPDWRLGAGDHDSLVLRWTQRWEHVGTEVTHHTFAVVARSGPAIVLVADAGWETSSGSRELAENLITPAVRRAASLH